MRRSKRVLGLGDLLNLSEFYSRMSEIILELKKDEVKAYIFFKLGNIDGRPMGNEKASNKDMD